MEPLLALQEIDGQIRELQHEIRDIPARKDDEKGRLSDTAAKLEDARARKMDIQARIDEAQQEIAAQQEQIKKFRQQQATLKTNQEFRAMDTQIKYCEEEIATQEGIVAESQAQLPPVVEEIEMIQVKYDEEKSGVDANIAELEDRQAQAAEMLGQLEKERAEAVTKVPAQQLSYYTRLSKSRWPVVVPLENGSVCGGCHLVQPPSAAHLLKRNNVLVACQMCGRLLCEE